MSAAPASAINGRQKRHNLAASTDFASAFDRLLKPIEYSRIIEISAKRLVWLVKSEWEVLPECRNAAKVARLCRESHREIFQAICSQCQGKLASVMDLMFKDMPDNPLSGVRRRFFQALIP